MKDADRKGLRPLPGPCVGTGVKPHYIFGRGKSKVRIDNRSYSTGTHIRLGTSGAQVFICLGYYYIRRGGNGKNTLSWRSMLRMGKNGDGGKTSQECETALTSQF